MRRGTKYKDKYNSIWFRVLKRKHDGQWGKSLAQIDNFHLRVKVAALCFWDCYEPKENYDWSYCRELSGQYKNFFENSYSLDELVNALILIGYTSENAKKRSIPPKVTNGRRKKK